jgi:hypothetical protein
MKNISLDHFRALRAAYDEAYGGLNPFDLQFSQLVNIKMLPSQTGDKPSNAQRFIGLLKRLFFRCFTLPVIIHSIRSSDFVFFLAEPTHLKQNLPVVKCLRNRGYSVSLLLSKLKLIKELDEESRRYKIHVLQAVDLPRKGRRKQQEIFRNTKKVLMKNPMPTSLEKAFICQIPLLLSIENTWQKALAKSKVKAIIIGNDIPRDGRVVTSVAAQLRIPSFMIQHGNIPDDSLHSEHMVDHLLLFGDQSARRLKALGLAAERLVVTGPPYLDNELKRNRFMAVKRLREFLSLDATPPEEVILVAVSGAGHRTSLTHHKKIIRALLDLAIANVSLTFLVKLHRKDRSEFYREISNDVLPSNFLIVEHIPQEITSNIFDWIELASTVITTNSSVGGEAILLQKNLISIDLMDEYKGVDYQDYNACIKVSSNEELLLAFENLRKNGLPENMLADMKKFMDAFYGPARDGKSAERCANILAKQAKAL